MYISRVMQAIYEDYWLEGDVKGFMMLMLTFDHIDLQYLLFQEEGKELTPKADGSESESLAAIRGGVQQGAQVAGWVGAFAMG